MVLEDIKTLTATEIRELRYRMGLTQHEFAEVIGVRPVTISRWENGAVTPTRLALIRLEELQRKLHRKEWRETRQQPKT